MTKGKVFLIGAGPGDPGLITVKGKQAIEAADLIVYDFLANSALLQYAKDGAELIYVGKSGSCHTLEQEEIDKLLVDKAGAGLIVARLKGGDPFIFGRGGEEALALVAEGIEFEVIPGVSSAYGAPAYGGIPVTHRGMASSVSFITGHEDPTKEKSEIDWQALACLKGTLVFLMGIKNLGQITGRLIEAGKDEDTLVAVIRRGTTASQEMVLGTLKDIAAKVQEAGLKAPAIIVIGQVVSLADELAWFTKKPLFGKRIIVTRARRQASALSAKFNALGAEAIEFPTFKIAPPTSFDLLDAAISDIKNPPPQTLHLKPVFDWVIFTSANGVKAFMERLNHLGGDIRCLKGAKLAAIGPATAGELAACNLKVDLVPTEFVAEAVAEALKKENISGAKILIARAEEARDILITELEAAGASLTVAPAYKSVIDGAAREQVRQMLAKREIDFITFTSSSTVKNFIKLLEGPNLSELLKGVVIASIGPITSATARELGLNVDIEAKEYTIDGLVAAIINSKVETEQ